MIISNRCKDTVVQIAVGLMLAASTLGLARADLVAQEGVVSGGNGTIFVTTYAHEMLVIDESTYEVVERIPTQSGIPGDMLLSSNREHFYVLDATGEHIEVFDIAARTSTGHFTLSGGARQFRISGFQIDPTETYAIIAGKNATKRIDRWEIGPNLLLRYSLETNRVTDTISWPDNHERERGVNVQFSPDGSLLYFYSQDVIVLETENFTEVDRWEISRPLEPGLGRAGLGFRQSLYEEPGFYTGLFRVSDPVQNRRMMGIARVNLAEKSVDFYTLGPNEPVQALALAPDRSKAYSLYSSIGRYEFWTFDLENRSVSNRAEFAGRPRMNLSVSTNGEYLYITNAGRTIEIHDAETYEHLRTVEIDGDMTDFQLLPPGSP